MTLTLLQSKTTISVYTDVLASWSKGANCMLFVYIRDVSGPISAQSR